MDSSSVKLIRFFCFPFLDWKYEKLTVGGDAAEKTFETRRYTNFLLAYSDEIPGCIRIRLENVCSEDGYLLQCGPLSSSKRNKGDTEGGNSLSNKII